MTVGPVKVGQNLIKIAFSNKYQEVPKVKNLIRKQFQCLRVESRFHDTSLNLISFILSIRSDYFSFAFVTLMKKDDGVRDTTVTKTRGGPLKRYDRLICEF